MVIVQGTIRLADPAARDAYLAAAVHCLGFHPPSRTKMSAPLLGYLAGAPLEIV